jgi:hypothetical protein
MTVEENSKWIKSFDRGLMFIQQKQKLQQTPLQKEYNTNAQHTNNTLTQVNEKD